MQCPKCGTNVEDCEARRRDVQVSESVAPGVVVHHAATVCVTCSRMDAKSTRVTGSSPPLRRDLRGGRIAYLWGVGF